MNIQTHNADLISEIDGELLVSSMVIAENAEIEHRGVLKSIDSHIRHFEEFGRVVIELQPFETNGGVQKRRVAYLNENQAMLLMTFLRNNEIVLNFKTALISAFSAMKQRLKAQPSQFHIPSTLSEALLLASKQAEQIERQNALLLEQKPKVAFATTVESSTNSVLIRDYAKSIGLKEKEVREWLEAKGYIYRDAKGKWKHYATDTAKKYFELVPTTNATTFGTFVNYTLKIKGEGQVAVTDKILNDLKGKKCVV